MFIDSDSLQERLRRTNLNLDEVKFKRDHSLERIPDSTNEVEPFDSNPLSPDDLGRDIGDLTVHILPKRGRVEGYKNRSEAERTLIGIESKILGQTEAARINNISQSYAGLCEKGKSNTDGATLSNSNKVDSHFAEIRSKALEGLHSSVSVLNEKIDSGMKTNDAIGIASTLVKIVSISSPAERSEQASRLIIMAPQMREEKLYEVIDVGRS